MTTANPLRSAAWCTSPLIEHIDGIFECQNQENCLALEENHSMGVTCGWAASPLKHKCKACK